MKKIAIMILVCIVSAKLQAQTVHTVKPGETLSGIAQKNGTTVGEIMRLNGMKADSKLVTGANIKIPAKGKAVKPEAAANAKKPATNTKQPAANTTNTKPAAPVARQAATNTNPKPAASKASGQRTHTVAAGETLSQLAEKYNTTVGDIMRLNAMNADSKLVIGQALKIPAQGVTVVRKEAPATKARNADDDDEIVAANTVTTFEADPAPASAPAMHNDSYFAGSYRTNGVEMQTSGDAKIFKSSSGWNDKKYFILMNDLEPGRVVKVQNGDNTIYAKVLWNLGSGKENQGLTYRLSDAAAQTLGLKDDKFSLQVTYYR